MLLIRNTNNFRISKAVAAAILVDDLNALSGFSKTEISNLAPFEERNFQIFIPISKDLRDRVNVDETEVFVEVLK